MIILWNILVYFIPLLCFCARETNADEFYSKARKLELRLANEKDNQFYQHISLLLGVGFEYFFCSPPSLSISHPLYFKLINLINVILSPFCIESKFVACSIMLMKDICSMLRVTMS